MATATAVRGGRGAVVSTFQFTLNQSAAAAAASAGSGSLTRGAGAAAGAGAGAGAGTASQLLQSQQHLPRHAKHAKHAGPSSGTASRELSKSMVDFKKQLNKMHAEQKNVSAALVNANDELAQRQKEVGEARTQLFKAVAEAEHVR